MKKQIFTRALLGFPLGIAISQVILLIVSLCLGNGTFEPCTPHLAELIGSELGAAALQTLICGFIGAVSAASSVIWDTDWGIVKQTGLYFAILAVAMLPAAYLMGWMKHVGFLRYFGGFVLIFAVIWLVQYFAWKRRIKKLNERMKRG